jgi:hypothetical protein
MGTLAKGLTGIDIQLHEWNEEDRLDAIEFAKNPAHGATAILLYLRSKNVKTSMGTVDRWLKGIRLESDRVTKMKAIFDDFRGVTPDEVNSYCAATMAFVMITLQKDIEEKGLDLRKIQTLTSLAKEARSSAMAMNTPHSSASMKELELGHALSFTQRLEDIFEGDDVILERIKSACKAIMVEIEGQY